MVQCVRCGAALLAELVSPLVPCCEGCQPAGESSRPGVEPGHISIEGQPVAMYHNRPGLNSSATADDQGHITEQVCGPAPKGEEDALEVCERLVRALRQLGEKWLPPELVDEKDVDCRSRHEGEIGSELQMQVVRASTDAKLWRSVSVNGVDNTSGGASKFACELIDSVKKKSKHYSLEQKRKLLLVLDATRTPACTFPRVLDVFKAEHLATCRDAGFAQVWLVGPQDPIVERLDR